MDFYTIYLISLLVIIIGIFIYRLRQGRHQNSYNSELRPHMITVAPQAMKDHELIEAYNAKLLNRGELKKIKMLLHQRKLIYKL